MGEFPQICRNLRASLD